MGSGISRVLSSRRGGASRALALSTCVVLAMASMSVARAVMVPATAPSPAAVPVAAPPSPAAAPLSAAAASGVSPAATPLVAPLVAASTPRALTPRALTVPAVTLPAPPATSLTASDYLYRATGQTPLQWKCAEHKLYMRGFPSTWTALITAKVKELNTAIPRLTWKVVTGPVPAGSEAVIEYRSFGSPVRGLTQHTITPTLFRTVVVSINKDLVLSPVATASGVTIMHELAHAEGLDHRDTDPDSATTRHPRAGVGPFTGKLSPGDRAAFLIEGCAP